MAQRTDNPERPSEWEDSVRAEGLDPNTIQVSDASFKSGSKLNSLMFLHLKVLVKTYPAGDLKVQDITDVSCQQPDFTLLKRVVDTFRTEDPIRKLEPNLFTPHQYMTHLVTHSEKVEPDDVAPKIAIFHQYLQQKDESQAVAAMASLKLSDSPPPPGTTPATPPQRGSPVPPASPSSNPQAQYEAVVNMSLVLFLLSVRLHCKHLPPAWRAQWHPDPKRFIMKSSQGTQLFEARVDGYLSRSGKRDALAILETKPFVRLARRRDIERQEGAQMAAWISSESRYNAPGVLTRLDQPAIQRRVLISQDRHEIYVTIAEYDDDYVGYVTDGRIAKLPGRKQDSSPSGAKSKGYSHSPAASIASSEGSSHGRGPEAGFLKMNVYGPFCIDRGEDMENLAQIVTHLCVALLA